MNLVVLVTGSLSETLQATPLLRTLQHELPSARVTLAGPPAAAQLAGGLPGVTETIPLRALGIGGGPLQLAGAWWQLRRRRFDAALVCSATGRARLLAYTTGIPRRVGPGGGGSALLLSQQITAVRGENNAATWLRLAAPLGARGTLHAPGFEPEAAAREAGEAQLLGTGFEDGRILVALAPGSRGWGSVPPPGAVWSHECYAHLANQLAVRHGAAIVLLGSMEDRPRVEATLLDVDARVLDLAGQIGLDETAAVLARCDLLVAGDSPLLHLAAAVGTPSVGLFGPTDGAIRGPYGNEHRVIQAVPDAVAADGRRSVARIRVEDVLAGIEGTI